MTSGINFTTIWSQFLSTLNKVPLRINEWTPGQINFQPGSNHSVFPFRVLHKAIGAKQSCRARYTLYDHDGVETSCEIDRSDHFLLHLLNSCVYFIVFPSKMAYRRIFQEVEVWPPPEMSEWPESRDPRLHSSRGEKWGLPGLRAARLSLLYYKAENFINTGLIK